MGTKITDPERPGTRTRFPPAWTSLLAVIAHPDEESSGLGAILDAFVFARTRVEVLCLTHGQVWTLNEAPGDLAALRGAELASAFDVLGPRSTTMSGHPDGNLGDLCQSTLAGEVVVAADSCHPDGLLVFDASAVAGHPDHLAAASAGLLGAQTLDLPVLAWTLAKTVAAQLSREFGTSLTGHPVEAVDLRMSFLRAQQRLASRQGLSGTTTGADPRRRLDLLAESESLRWLRPPRTPAAPWRSQARKV